MAHTRHTTHVVFVPGFMQRGEAWAPLAGKLARSGWPTSFVDFDRPTLDGCLDTIERAAAGGVAVGYSMGGRLALHAAARHPGAFAALVLVGVTPGIEDEALRRSRRAADDSLALWMEEHRIDAVVDLWESQPVFATQSEALVRAQRQGRLAHDPRVLAALLRETGQGALDPVWPQLGQVDVPVLAIAGEEDEKYARVAERMAEALPRGRAALVPGAGHAPQLEQPEAVLALVGDFLDEHFGERLA